MAWWDMRPANLSGSRRRSLSFLWASGQQAFALIFTHLARRGLWYSDGNTTGNVQNLGIQYEHWLPCVVIAMVIMIISTVLLVRLASCFACLSGTNWETTTINFIWFLYALAQGKKQLSLEPQFGLPETHPNGCFLYTRKTLWNLRRMNEFGAGAALRKYF